MVLTRSDFGDLSVFQLLQNIHCYMLHKREIYLLSIFSINTLTGTLNFF